MHDSFNIMLRTARLMTDSNPILIRDSMTYSCQTISHCFKLMIIILIVCQ